MNGVMATKTHRFKVFVKADARLPVRRVMEYVQDALDTYASLDFDEVHVTQVYSRQKMARERYEKQRV